MITKWVLTVCAMPIFLYNSSTPTCFEGKTELHVYGTYFTAIREYAFLPKSYRQTTTIQRVTVENFDISVDSDTLFYKITPKTDPPDWWDFPVETGHP